MARIDSNIMASKIKLDGVTHKNKFQFVKISFRESVSFMTVLLFRKKGIMKRLHII